MKWHNETFPKKHVRQIEKVGIFEEVLKIEMSHNLEWGNFDKEVENQLLILAINYNLSSVQSNSGQ